MLDCIENMRKHVKTQAKNMFISVRNMEGSILDSLDSMREAIVSRQANDENQHRNAQNLFTMPKTQMVNVKMEPIGYFGTATPPQSYRPTIRNRLSLSKKHHQPKPSLSRGIGQAHFVFHLYFISCVFVFVLFLFIVIIVEDSDEESDEDVDDTPTTITNNQRPNASPDVNHMSTNGTSNVNHKPTNGTPNVKRQQPIVQPIVQPSMPDLDDPDFVPMRQKSRVYHSSVAAISKQYQNDE